MLTSAICALLLASMLLAAGLIGGFPSVGGGLCMIVGLPGYMAAANSAAQMFGPDEINSGSALFYFGLTYVVVNAAIFMFIFIGAWQLFAAFRRAKKQQGRI